MLIRICLIVAVVAGLAVAVVNFVQVKEVITTTRDTLNTTSNKLDQTQKTLTKTEKDLTSTKAELAVTKDTLKTTEETRDRALADAETNRKRAAELTKNLNATTKQRDDAQAKLVQWDVLGIPVEQVKQVIADLKEAQVQAVETKQVIETLNRQVVSLTNELAYYRDPDYRVKLPVGLKATVVAFDPKWDFVVLNVGENHGVLQHGELLVNREGKLVAKVHVLRVEKDRCIANLVSGWKIGEIIEGDSAIPAF